MLHHRSGRRIAAFRGLSLLIALLVLASSTTAMHPVAARTIATKPGPGDTSVDLYATLIPSQHDEIYAETRGWLTRYRIDATFTPESASALGSIRGTVDLLYVNGTGVPQSTLYFRLYPNNDEYADGGMTIDSVRIGLALADFTLGEADTLATVSLPKPVPDGGTATVKIAFTTTIPTDPARSYGMFSLDKRTGTYALAHWLPLLAGYDPITGWLTGPISRNGDPVFTNAALFNVTIEAPSAFTFVTTGDEVSSSIDGAIATRHFVSGPVRDFVMAADDDFRVLSETVGETVVNSYFNPGSDGGGQDVLTSAAQSMAIYSELLGDYPYKQMDLVEVALGNGAGGVEFPQLMYIGTDYYSESDFTDAIPDYLEFVTAHEVGHQWWYGVVGNNQYQHAFIDEGLTNYMTTAYFGKQYGAEAARTQINLNLKAAYFSVLFNGGDQIVDQPTDDFPSMTSYGAIVYGKASLGFLELRTAIGDDAFFGGLAAYAHEFRFKIATPADMKAAFEHASGRDLDEFWRHWFEAAEGRQDFNAADLAELLREIGS